MVDSGILAGSILAALIAVFASQLVQYIRENNKIADQISLSIESVIKELEDISCFIQDRKNHTIERTSNGVRLHEASIQKAAFDSMIYSGIFREIDNKIQIMLSNLYQEIKLSNQLSAQIEHAMAMGDSTSSTYVISLTEFGTAVDRKLNYIKTNIDKLLPILKSKKT